MAIGIFFKIKEEDDKFLEDYSWLKRQSKAATIRQMVSEFRVAHTQEVEDIKNISIKEHLQSD